MTFFVGLDWATREHAVCVVDERGAVVTRFTAAHTASGMEDLVARLTKLAPAPELRVAIERPTGLIVDTLVEQRFAVVPIHPNAVKAARPRYSAAQGKTDLGDAYLLADLLRTDGHRFRTLAPLSDETKALRGLVRVRDDMVGQRVATANQLRCLLEQFWPGATEIFADVDSPIALEFLDRYPTPQSASALGEKRMAAFMSRHAYSGRRSARELVERLRAAPRSIAGELEPRPRASACVRSSRCCARWSRSSRRSRRPSSTPSTHTPTARSSRRCSAAVACVRRRSSPRSATIVAASCPAITSRQRAALRP
jgi:hypothetical protein